MHVLNYSGMCGYGHTYTHTVPYTNEYKRAVVLYISTELQMSFLSAIQSFFCSLNSELNVVVQICFF